MGNPGSAKAAYVAFVLAHHPDRGGDVDTFVAGLAHVQAAHRRAQQGEHRHHPPNRYDAPIVVVVRPRGPRAILSRVRRWRDRRFRKPRVR